MTPFLLLLSIVHVVRDLRLPLIEAKNKEMPRILTGPCTQNEVGMKCTEKGFFETVQCDIYGCYCVSAHNGFIAYDTRTANNQTLPTCSRCHKALEHLYANGIPPEGTLIPTCDVASGNYEPMQCNLQQQRCYCVDPLTGDEIANTSKRMTSNEYIRCDDTKFLVKPTPLSTLNGVMLWKKDYPVPGKPCTLDRDRGVLHGSVKPSVRYYFDYETTVCLAFEYLGSGGNDNNYEEISDCLLSCTYQDYMSCSGKYPVARGPNGEPFICEIPRTTSSPEWISKRGPKLDEHGCPLGHQCIMGVYSGFCCNKANQDRYALAYTPKCTNGKPYSLDDSFPRTQLGKSCKDNFCPSNFTCHDGDIFAYCC